MPKLDDLIPPEIKNDQLYQAIKILSSDSSIDNILEIGSSSGEGSTQAFLEGMKENGFSNLYCLELSESRFEKLLDTVKKVMGKDTSRVKCFNMSSVPLREFPNEQQVTKFYRDIYSVLNNYTLATVLGWLKQDIEYIKEHFEWAEGFEDSGIEYIKKEFEIKNFDLVLIDGSEFTGYAEFKQIYGAGVIILDDIRSFKNYFSYRDLLTDSSYYLEVEDNKLRNGYAIFKRK